ncbi:MAG TPA: TRAP transporter large permease [Candidatus Aerophobetes bacterium]|uniref:TRAP transporter large permease n=2 Tax=Aerophobetes bacterium TaxID=2030807 RepID=A0A7V0MZQ3_UNCAE|nr:TRAP transporter large permease [Candidatus Aerophobetes bacterium]
MAVIVWILAFAAIFAMGYPIALGMFVSSVLYLLLSHIDLSLIVDNMVLKFESNFVLLAVPLFIFTAKVMNAGKITNRIFDLAQDALGSLRGGLGYVNIVASIIFAGMSGSEIADVAGLGTVEIKAMKDAGYDGPFACAVTCASATIGPIIPPSIPMIIYSMLSGASVGYLFLGGFIPGFLLGGTLMVVVYVLSVKRNYPRGKKIPFKKFVKGFVKSFPALMAPVLLLYGIYGGIFTPTESAGIVAAYVVILSLFVYRTLGLKELYKVIIDTVVSTGYISFIIAGAFMLSYVVAREEIPNLVANVFISLGLTSSKWITLLSINGLFLILGCFLDVSAIQLIIIPILLPLVKNVGIDLVHFGVITTFNLMIALDTPPYGETGFITSAISGTPLHKVVKEMLLYFIPCEIAALMLVTYLPDLVLWLPRLAGYAG